MNSIRAQASLEALLALLLLLLLLSLLLSSTQRLDAAQASGLLQARERAVLSSHALALGVRLSHPHVRLPAAWAPALAYQNNTLLSPRGAALVPFLGPVSRPPIPA